jgi:hypothetical protein
MFSSIGATCISAQRRVLDTCTRVSSCLAWGETYDLLSYARTHKLRVGFTLEMYTLRRYCLPLVCVTLEGMVAGSTLHVR